MQRKIAIIGKIEEVKSFMQTYKYELKLGNLQSVYHSYELGFFTQGIAFYPTADKTFRFVHISVRNPYNFKNHIADKSLNAVIMLNPSENDLQLVNEAKIRRSELKQTIPFLPLDHKVGQGPKLDVLKYIERVIYAPIYGSLYQGELPSGAVREVELEVENANKRCVASAIENISSLDINQDKPVDDVEEDHDECGMAMTVFKS